MKSNLNYCIVLSSEQLTYLLESKYGIDRMKILHRLIEKAVLKETKYAIKGFSTTLQVGQAVLSEVELSSKLGYDKKSCIPCTWQDEPVRNCHIYTKQPNKHPYAEMYIGMDAGRQPNW